MFFFLFCFFLYEFSSPAKRAYLFISGYQPGHNQLDHPSLVALDGHGLAQRLHGLLVGHPAQRLPVDGDELVVNAQTSILQTTRGEVKSILPMHF